MFVCYLEVTCLSLLLGMLQGLYLCYVITNSASFVSSKCYMSLGDSVCVFVCVCVGGGGGAAGTGILFKPEII